MLPTREIQGLVLQDHIIQMFDVAPEVLGHHLWDNNRS